MHRAMKKLDWVYLFNETTKSDWLIQVETCRSTCINQSDLLVALADQASGGSMKFRKNIKKRTHLILLVLSEFIIYRKYLYLSNILTFSYYFYIFGKLV